MKYIKQLALFGPAILLLMGFLQVPNAHAADSTTYNQYNFHLGWGDSYYGDDPTIPSLQFEYPNYLQPSFSKGHSYSFSESGSSMPSLILGWSGNADMYTAKGGEPATFNGIVGVMQTTGVVWDRAVQNGDGSWYMPGTYAGERFSFG